MLSFKLRVNRYDLAISNEILFIVIAQGAAKLWPVKVGGWSNPFLLSKSCDLLDRPPTLTGHSFAAPWAMIMKSCSIESPKPYLLIIN